MSRLHKFESHRDLRKSLIEDGIITQEQIKSALDEMQIGETWADVLIRKNVLSEKDWLKYLEKHGIGLIDPSHTTIDTEVATLIAEHIARQYRFIPIKEIGGQLTIATPDPDNIPAQDYIKDNYKKESILLVCTQQQLEDGWQNLYHPKNKSTIEEFNETLEEFEKGDIAEAEITQEEEAKEEIELQELQSMVSDAPVIRMVNMIVAQSIAAGASDIHVCPQEHDLIVRHRIDGILHPMTTIPKKLEKVVISRLKIMSGMDIAEHRVPQDGRFKVKFRGKQVDVRASLFPTQYGGNIVMRLLHRSSAMVKLVDLGFMESTLEQWKFLLGTSGKIVLVTGPTGSGKTTTLYASLNAINDPKINIMTIEDPIEYNLPLIRQAQVNTKAGMTFAGGLRSILRQDPDVVMVGEIRDEETAKIAIQAALTGHLVFSTLHTNSAVGALSRLVDMGIEPFLVSSALQGILGQRLVRKICVNCKTKENITDDIKARFASEHLDMITQAFVGKGCDVCHGTGYRGRSVITELVVVNRTIRNLILQKSSESEIIDTAKKECDMKTLRQDGMAKVMAGITTISEVFRVTPED